MNIQRMVIVSVKTHLFGSGRLRFCYTPQFSQFSLHLLWICSGLDVVHRSRFSRQSSSLIFPISLRVLPAVNGRTGTDGPPLRSALLQRPPLPLFLPNPSYSLHLSPSSTFLSVSLILSPQTVLSKQTQISVGCKWTVTIFIGKSLQVHFWPKVTDKIDVCVTLNRLTLPFNKVEAWFWVTLRFYFSVSQTVGQEDISLGLVQGTFEVYKVGALSLELRQGRLELRLSRFLFLKLKEYSIQFTDLNTSFWKRTV